LPFTFARGPAGAVLLQFALVVFDSSKDELFQGALVNRIALEEIDRSSCVAFQARVKELVGIGKTRPMGKGQLHLSLVGVSNRDHSIAGPHRASHPLPFLDDLPVGAEDNLADTGERLAAPVGDSRYQLIDLFRCIHWLPLLDQAGLLQQREMPEHRRL